MLTECRGRFAVLALAMVITSVLTGCMPKKAIKFYGIHFEKTFLGPEGKIDKIKSKGDGTFTYTFTGSANAKISAHIELSQYLGSSGLNADIQINNNSDNPISTNYFADEVCAIAKDGKRYKFQNRLEEGKTINPGGVTWLSISLPSVPEGFNIEDVKSVEVILGLNGVRIKAVKLPPEMQPKSPEEK